MSCEKTSERLLGHLYGALEENEAAAVREHLEGCPDCRAALDRASAQKALLAEAATLAADDLTLPAPPERPRRILRWAAVAAAIRMMLTA